MHLFVYFALCCDNFGWFDITPRPYECVVTEQLIEAGRQVVVDFETLLDEFLAPPLLMFDLLHRSLNGDTQSDEQDWREAVNGEPCDF